jgi:hypothetical protein
MLYTSMLATNLSANGVTIVALNTTFLRSAQETHVCYLQRREPFKADDNAEMYFDDQCRHRDLKIYR